MEIFCCGTASPSDTESSSERQQSAHAQAKSTPRHEHRDFDPSTAEPKHRRAEDAQNRIGARNGMGTSYMRRRCPTPPATLCASAATTCGKWE